jgi:hypothetical protein
MGYQTIFDYKSDPPFWGNKTGENHRFEYTHVVTDDNYRTLCLSQVIHPIDMEFAATLFDQTKNFVGRGDPLVVIVLPIQRDLPGPENDFQKPC